MLLSDKGILKKIIIRLFLRLTLSKRSAFCCSVLASWIYAISSAGIPLAISLSRISSYTQKSHSSSRDSTSAIDFLSLASSASSPSTAASAALCGTPKSQKMICVSLSSAVSAWIRTTFSTQRLSFVSGLSSKDGSISLGSRPSFLPSDVILSILSIVGSTFPALIASARSASS